MGSGTLSNAGINQILSMAFNTSNTYTVPSILYAGTDSTAAAVTDTALGNKVPLTRTTIHACDATAGWSVEGDAAAVVLNETAGEFKEGTGCINIPSTFAAGSSGWYRTIGATDLSSKYVGMFLYLSSKTNLGTGSSTVRLTLGTGGFTDINKYDFADTELSVGWNFLVIDVDNPTSTSGSGATTSAVDRIKLTVTITGSYTGTQMRMDQWWYATSANFQSSLVVGYPTFDTLNRQVTLRYNINGTQLNNFDLQEFNTVNTDTSVIQLLRGTNTKIEKTSSYEVNYVIKIRGTQA